MLPRYLIPLWHGFCRQPVTWPSFCGDCLCAVLLVAHRVSTPSPLAQFSFCWRESEENKPQIHAGHVARPLLSSVSGGHPLRWLEVSLGSEEFESLAWPDSTENAQWSGECHHLSVPSGILFPFINRPQFLKSYLSFTTSQQETKFQVFIVYFVKSFVRSDIADSHGAQKCWGCCYRGGARGRGRKVILIFATSTFMSRRAHHCWAVWGTRYQLAFIPITRRGP